jgi:hypothetical protein
MDLVTVRFSMLVLLTVSDEEIFIVLRQWAKAVLIATGCPEGSDLGYRG